MQPGAPERYFNMMYHLDVNDVEPDHWVAWVFELHGCYARGHTAEQAISSAPEAISDFLIWRDGYGNESPIDSHSIVVSEQVASVDTGEAYLNAHFEHDRRPLSSEDIDQISIILSYSRNNLNSLLQSIPHDFFTQPISKERFGTINGILNHIATAEWWYFDSIKLGLNRDELTGKPDVDLSLIREKTLAVMPELIGRSDIFDRNGETWSARKVLRRTMWHEIMHTRHIRRRLSELESA